MCVVCGNFTMETCTLCLLETEKMVQIVEELQRRQVGQLATSLHVISGPDTVLFRSVGDFVFSLSSRINSMADRK